MKIVDFDKYRIWRLNKLMLQTVKKENGCIEFIGYTDPITGYGYSKYLNSTVYAHRLSYILNVGDIPEGKQINHHCDNKRCINPSHLYCGTQHENVRDAVERKRYKRFQGEKNGNAKLTEFKVNEIRNKKGTQNEIAAIYGVSRSLIGLIKSGKKWAHV